MCCGFKVKKGSEIEKYVDDRNIYIISFKREYNEGIENILVSIESEPNSKSSIAWFNATDLIIELEENWKRLPYTDDYLKNLINDVMTHKITIDECMNQLIEGE